MKHLLRGRGGEVKLLPSIFLGRRCITGLLKDKLVILFSDIKRGSQGLVLGVILAHRYHLG